MQELGLELKRKILKQTINQTNKQNPNQQNKQQKDTKTEWTHEHELSSVLKVTGGNSVQGVMSLSKAAKRPENYLPVWDVLS